MEHTEKGQLTQVVSLLTNAKDLLENKKFDQGPRVNMQTEVRTLEFWRAIIAECVATFLLVVMVSSSHQSLAAGGASGAQMQLFLAVATGLAVIVLTRAFLSVSGAHLNPALTLSAIFSKKISLLRASLYICAQCGGAIAGAALVYGIHGAQDQFSGAIVADFAMEFILTFVVAFTYFCSTNPYSPSQPLLDPAVTIGLSYMACLSCYKGALNPARALGPAFVANKFLLHWIFWVGPILGGICGAVCHKFIFNVHKPRLVKKDMENCSLRSDEDMLDDLERVKQMRSNMINQNILTEAPNHTIHQGKQYRRPMDCDSVYGGTKSMYNGHLPGGQDSGRRTPGVDCSKSVYGEGEEYGQRRQMYNRSSLKRTVSTHSKAGTRRNPYDNLPEAPNKLGQPQQENEQAYLEYIKRKNAASDQCSGSSSGYYSGRGDVEGNRVGDHSYERNAACRGEIYDNYDPKDINKRGLGARNVSAENSVRENVVGGVGGGGEMRDYYGHHREHSLGRRSEYSSRSQGGHRGGGGR